MSTPIKPRYSIHPAIGIARLGNSPNQFYIAPEATGALPIDCDKNGKVTKNPDGTEPTVSSFKDGNGCIKRQAARFKIFRYDDQNPGGIELKKGDIVYNTDGYGPLIDIEWTVYIANKKAVWYQFQQQQGEHGYAPDHPLRNADITSSDVRQNLIIDPGYQTIYGGFHNTRTSAAFAKGQNPACTQSFPPPLVPNSIDTLGNVMTTVTDDGNIQLLVLGGFGNSGSFKTELGSPIVQSYANNDGWFDDISDGPVTAKLIYHDGINNMDRYISTGDPSWVIVGYPRYAPQITDMITTDDLLYDLYVREFGFNPYLYGTAPYASSEPMDTSNPQQLAAWRRKPKKYNPDFYPYFEKDIWPILQRPYNMQWCTDILGVSNAAHDTTTTRSDFYPPYMGTPPKPDGTDPYKAKRQYVYAMLRLPGEENQFFNHHVPMDTNMYDKPLMPLLCGNNPINNVLPDKFLRLTDTQLFMLKQWVEGKFINETNEAIDDSAVEQITDNGLALDRGVLGNALGGAFCPGAETTWIVRNPAVYAKPYRVKADPNYIPSMTNATVAGTPGDTPILDLPSLSQGQSFDTGMQPGDITKFSGLPWQTDFNECSTQTIDITYEIWNQLYPGSTNDSMLASVQKTMIVLWWPSHRPMQVFVPQPSSNPNAPVSYLQEDWARGIPQTYAGDLKMVTEWSKLGFVVANPAGTNNYPSYVESEYTGQN